MAADTLAPVSLGILDISKAGGTIDFDVSPWTAGSIEVSPVGAAPNYGSWACSIKQANGPAAPLDFPTPLGFSSSALIQRATDLTGVSRLILTNDVVTSATGLVEFWGTFKAGTPLT